MLWLGNLCLAFWLVLALGAVRPCKTGNRTESTQSETLQPFLTSLGKMHRFLRLCKSYSNHFVIDLASRIIHADLTPR